jgi:hypothetical protein
MIWRKSTYSAANGDCVEVGEAEGFVLIRNSNHPDRSSLALPAAAVGAWVRACAAGELDDLTV